LPYFLTIDLTRLHDNEKATHVVIIIDL